MIMAGILDPLSLPTMHHLLDVVEMIVIEGMHRNDDIQRFYYRTYQPDPDQIAQVGFTEEESEASFTAFSVAIGNMH